MNEYKVKILHEKKKDFCGVIIIIMLYWGSSKLLETRYNLKTEKMFNEWIKRTSSWSSFLNNIYIDDDNNNNMR